MTFIINKPTRVEIAARIGASLAGGYGFTLGFVSFGISAAAALGVPFADARTLFHLLAGLVFLACLCWAFAARSVARVWAVLVVGGAALAATAWRLVAASALG